jgi:hypothetical protein
MSKAKQTDAIRLYRQKPPVALGRAHLAEWQPVLEAMIRDSHRLEGIFVWMTHNYKTLGFTLPAKVTVRDWLVAIRKEIGEELRRRKPRKEATNNNRKSPASPRKITGTTANAPNTGKPPGQTRTAQPIGKGGGLLLAKSTDQQNARELRASNIRKITAKLPRDTDGNILANQQPTEIDLAKIRVR